MAALAQHRADHAVILVIGLGTAGGRQCQRERPRAGDLLRHERRAQERRERAILLGGRRRTPGLECHGVERDRTGVEAPRAQPCGREVAVRAHPGHRHGYRGIERLATLGYDGERHRGGGAVGTGGARRARDPASRIPVHARRPRHSIGHGRGRANTRRRAHPHRVLLREMRQRVQERLHARDHAHAAEVLIALDREVGLLTHLLGEELVEHGVGTAAVVGEVHREEPRIAPHHLGAREDVLPKRPADAGVVSRDIDIMRVQVPERDDLLSTVQQNLGDSHVEGTIGDTVVARDEHEHALPRRERTQELVAQRLGLLTKGRDGKAARHHGHGRLLARMAQPLAQPQQRLRHGLLAKIHVEQGVQ